MKIVLIGILLLLSPLLIKAQWTSDTQVNTPVCVAEYNQIGVEILSDGTGGAIIVWIDFRGDDYDIYAQKMNSDGVAQWSENGVVVSDAPNHQTEPALLSDGTGGAIIAWQDSRNGNSEVYAQRINSSGEALWAAGGVAIAEGDGWDQFYTKIASDGSGGAIITWQEYRGGRNNIYAQRINSSGAIQWAASGAVVCDDAGNQQYPETASDGSGGAVITWLDYRNGNADVYAQRINSAGVVQWAVSGEVICVDGSDQYMPQITSDEMGGAIIAWQDRRNDSHGDIYAQRINAAGVVEWAADGNVVCESADQQQSIQMVSDRMGDAIIAWQDKRNSNYDVYAQRINSRGWAQWTESGVAVCDNAGSQTSPAIVSDGTGGAFITWYDYRNGNWDVYAQKLNSVGVAKWTEGGEPISINPGVQQYPAICQTGTGNAIIAWRDNRNYNYDVYAQYSGVLVSEPADFDGDGVDDEVENAGPNNGDANYDGFRDADQVCVVSMPSWDGEHYICVDTRPIDDLHPPKNVKSTGPGVPFDKEFKVYPLGMTSFRMEGDPGFNAAFYVYFFHDIHENDAARIFEDFKWYCKSPPDYDKYEWREIPRFNGSYGWVECNVGTIGEDNYISAKIVITDNEFGDSNPTPGIIDDPIAPYIAGAVVPSVGEFGGAALIVSLLALGVWIIANPTFRRV